MFHFSHLVIVRCTLTRERSKLQKISRYQKTNATRVERSRMINNLFFFLKLSSTLSYSSNLYDGMKRSVLGHE